jgi:hypothetical protein
MIYFDQVRDSQVLDIPTLTLLLERDSNELKDPLDESLPVVASPSQRKRGNEHLIPTLTLLLERDSNDELKDLLDESLPVVASASQRKRGNEHLSRECLLFLLPRFSSCI